jgi:hypothetical protein
MSSFHGRHDRLSRCSGEVCPLNWDHTMHVLLRDTSEGTCTRFGQLGSAQAWPQHRVERVNYRTHPWAQVSNLADSLYLQACRSSEATLRRSTVMARGGGSCTSRGAAQSGPEMRISLTWQPILAQLVRPGKCASPVRSLFPSMHHGDGLQCVTRQCPQGA